MRKTNRTGFSLIEFAISLAVLLPVIFGAIDINNTMRAYNALKKGSEIALRCIYPTDGACMTAANHGAPRLFNWFESKHTDRYFVRDVEYRGRGEWLSAPTYIYDSYHANILNSVSFQVPQVQVSASVPTMQVSHGVSVFVRRSGLPWVMADNVNNPLGRQVHFTADAAGRVGFPQATQRNSGGQTIIDTAHPALTYTVRLQNPFAARDTTPQHHFLSYQAAHPEMAIYHATDSYFDNNNALPANPTNALGVREDSLFGPSNTIKAIVYVRGNLSGQSAATVSKLLLNINGDRQGGQLLHGNGPLNFYPRGVGGSAEGKHGTARIDGLLPSAQEWTYTVDLHWGNNTIDISRTNQDSDGSSAYSWDAGQSWMLTSVEVYIPRFNQVTVPTSCEQTSCQATPCGSFQGISVVPSENTAAYPAALMQGAITSQVTGTSETNLGVFASVSEAARTTSCSNDALHVTTASPLSISGQACPTNTGAVTEAQKLSVCAPQHEAFTNGYASPQQVAWSTSTITLPANAAERAQGGWDYTFTKHDCNTQFQFSAPSALARYADIITPREEDFNPSRTTRTAMGGVEGRPSTVKGTTQAYACDAIQLEEMIFDGHRHPTSPSNLPTSSIFSGLRPERATTQECSLNVKNDATQNGLPTQAWFEPEMTPVRETEIEHKPTDSCSVFRHEIVQDPVSRLIASQLPEGQTPEACQSNGGCSKVFAGLDRNAQDSNNQGPDLKMAQQLAYDAVVASYPHALKNCHAGDIECLETAVETDNPTAPKKAAVRSTMRVPLNLLGGAAVTLSNRQERELETSFVQ